MKIKQYQILIIWLCFMLPMPIAARAGGGSSAGSGGSSAGSGNTHTHHYGSSDPMDSFFSFLGMGGLLILLPAMPMIVYRKRVKKKAKESEILLDQLEDTDRIWNEKEILQRVEDMYYHVQKAWTNADIKGFEGYLTPRLLKQWETKLTWIKLRNERNVLEDIRLLHHAIVGVHDHSDDNQDTCWIYRRQYGGLYDPYGNANAV